MLTSSRPLPPSIRYQPVAPCRRTNPLLSDLRELSSLTGKLPPSYTIDRSYTGKSELASEGDSCLTNVLLRKVGAEG